MCVCLCVHVSQIKKDICPKTIVHDSRKKNRYVDDDDGVYLGCYDAVSLMGDARQWLIARGVQDGDRLVSTYSYE